MLNAMQVADYIINTQQEEEAEITPLKLQKLLYYCQGFFLAVYGKGLFSDPIEAWQHGPVVRSVYNTYNGSLVLHPQKGYKPNLGLTKDQTELLTEVLSEYGRFSAWALRELTHSEKPWVDAFKSGHNAPLDQSTMTDFFKTQLSS